MREACCSHQGVFEHGNRRVSTVFRTRTSCSRRSRHRQAGGWGLYIAHQLCDLVQLRSDERGTVVRLHMALTPTG